MHRGKGEKIETRKDTSGTEGYEEPLFTARHLQTKLGAKNKEKGKAKNVT